MPHTDSTYVVDDLLTTALWGSGGHSVELFEKDIYERQYLYKRGHTHTIVIRTHTNDQTLTPNAKSFRTHSIVNKTVKTMFIVMRTRS